MIIMTGILSWSTALCTEAHERTCFFLKAILTETTLQNEYMILMGIGLPSFPFCAHRQFVEISSQSLFFFVNEFMHLVKG